MLAGVEAQLAVAVAGLGCLTGKVNAVLAAFEPEGTAVAEELEAARGRLGVFARGVAEDVSQYTLGLVKSHFPEADLEPVGDGIVGVYRQACSGIPLAVGFVGRDLLL